MSDLEKQRVKLLQMVEFTFDNWESLSAHYDSPILCVMDLALEFDPKIKDLRG